MSALAAILGVTQPAVGRWEDGDCYPEREREVRLAERYQIPYSRLRLLGIPTVGDIRDPLAGRDPWATR